MSRLMDSEVAEILDRYDTVWLSLHHESPEAADPFTSEVVGASYGRVRVRMGQPEGRTVFNISAGKFSGLPAFKLTHIGAWTHQVNGRMRFYVSLGEEAKRIRLGQTFTINAGELALSLD